MKHLTSILCLSLLINMLSYSETCICTFKFQNEITDYVKLGYYYGNHMLLLDSLKTNKIGRVDFKIKACESRLYYLAINQQMIFDFMLDECDSVKILFHDSSNLWNASVNGCVISKGYFDYLQLSETFKQKQLELIKEKADHEKKDSIDYYNELLLDLKNKFNSDISEIQRNNSGSLLDLYLKAYTPVEIPGLDSENNETSDNPDSWRKQILYYQSHYFDNIDFSDQRLVFIPVLTEKITHYLFRVLRQTSEDITKGIDLLMELSKINENVYQFVLDEIFHLYVNKRNETPVYEYIYVYFMNKYYLNIEIGIDSNLKILLIEDIEKRTPLLIHRKFPDEKLYTQNGSLFSLNAIHANYTIILFNEPMNTLCEEVKAQVQNLLKRFNYLSLQIVVLDVGRNPEGYMKELNFKHSKWTSIYTVTKDELLKNYNLGSFPVIFLLDSEKNIINKNITVNQLEQFLLNIALK